MLSLSKRNTITTLLPLLEDLVRERFRLDGSTQSVHIMPIVVSTAKDASADGHFLRPVLQLFEKIHRFELVGANLGA